MENVCTELLDKNKEHFSRCTDKAEKSYDALRHMQLQRIARMLLITSTFISFTNKLQRHIIEQKTRLGDGQKHGMTAVPTGLVVWYCSQVVVFLVTDTHKYAYKDYILHYISMW